MLETLMLRQAHELGRRAFIVSVGDLIDRGPDSAKVVTHFLRGTQTGSHAAILGNHELMLLQVLHYYAPQNFGESRCAWPLGLATLKDLYLQGGDWVGEADFQDFARRTCQLWLVQGGKETLLSLELDPNNPETWRLPLHWLEYLLTLPLYWQDEHTVVTHALIDRESLQQLRRAENLKQSITQESRQAYLAAQDKALWNRRPINRRADDFREHISGHTPVMALRYDAPVHALQIDTGCVYGQHLSAYCAEFKSALTVPAIHKYTLS